MAENKKSFILYCDVDEIIKDLPNEVKGQLFQLIIDYVNDKNPQPTDLLLKTAFAPIKAQLKRDLLKWEEIRAKKSAAGKASADKRQHKSTRVESVEHNPTDSTVNVTDNVTVTVNDNVNVNHNKPLKGREHFEHLKSFFSKPYQQQTQEFKNLYTEKEYNDFGKFLKAMLNDFQEQLEQKFDKCLSIGEWKSIFKCAGYMRVKPAIIKTLGAAQGDRQNMAARIFTYTGEEFTDKAFKL